MKARITAGTDQDDVGTFERHLADVGVDRQQTALEQDVDKGGHLRWFTARAHGLKLRPGDTVSVRAHGTASGQRGIEQTLIGASQVR
jgi:hypothetical protein